MTLFCITAAVLLITYKELKNSMGDSDYITVKVPTLKKKNKASVQCRCFFCTANPFFFSLTYFPYK